MCLLLIAIDRIPGLPLLLLGNRDEYHARPSMAAAPWPEDPRIAGGRDGVAGGAWLGLRSDGRFAAVTNLRSGVPATALRSRGALVRDALLGDAAADAFLQALAGEAGDFGPFNLVLGDAKGAFVFSSADRRVEALEPGVHVLSNGPPGVRWPKTERIAACFAAVLPSRPPEETGDRWLDLLRDASQPPDAALPDTGVGLELERRLAPVFIRGDRYGTRASTLAMQGADGTCRLRERRYEPGGRAAGETGWKAAPNAAFVGAPTS
jgi:uncharacterized protein with NRDE domain